MQFKKLSWQDIDIGINEVVSKINNPISIFGIKRGGIIPAIIISHKLNIEYKNGNFIIDDIVETGYTYNKYKNKGTFITLINKSKLDILSSNYLNNLVINKWVIFPWEDNSKAQQDYENYKNKRNI